MVGLWGRDELTVKNAGPSTVTDIVGAAVEESGLVSTASPGWNAGFSTGGSRGGRGGDSGGWCNGGRRYERRTGRARRRLRCR